MYAADHRTATAIRDHRHPQGPRPARRTSLTAVVARYIAELRGQVDVTSTPQPVQRPAL
ncbi:MAG: hypothetical protein R3343_10450 [Nitriliruptorales bacterium]|nr:hypothetical protein [Nitriliruptorales bacterium]